MERLSASQITKELEYIKGWKSNENSIQKDYKLITFADALAFIVKIGLEAEKMDHHPDLLLHGWNNVQVKLSTHSAGGVTENDFNLAQKIEKIHL